MSYSEFTFQSLRDNLALHLRQDASLFAHIEEVTISEYLQTTLQENVALALNINTEKARSEMIITPTVLDARPAEIQASTRALCSVPFFRELLPRRGRAGALVATGPPTSDQYSRHGVP
jgi:hypothetical protein